MFTDPQQSRVRGPIRIVSDVHWRHPVGIVRHPEQLAPLFDGAGTVIFNGDTVEQRSGTGRDGVMEAAGRFEECCRSEGAEAVFVNGNHDPDVSGCGLLEFAGGRVVVTHGDVLFPEIGIWGSSMPKLKSQCEDFFRDGQAQVFESVDELIDTVRGVCSRLIRERNGNPQPGVVSFFLAQGWPPVRTLRIIKCWLDTPERGAQLAARQKTRPRFMVMGHTHYPGIWRRRGLIVINTGSFMPPLGRTLVELDNGALAVRRIVYRRKAFRLGKTLGKWAVPCAEVDSFT